MKSDMENRNRPIIQPGEVYHLAADDVESIDVGNVLFISAAGGEAMGEPGAIYLVNEDNEWFRLSEYDLTNEQLKKVPIVNEILFKSRINFDDEWTHYYMGMGNNLYVHEKMANRFRDRLVELNVLDTTSRTACILKQSGIEKADIYSKWTDIVNQLLG